MDTLRLALISLLASTVPVAARAEEIVFVAKGEPKAVREVGSKWRRTQGYLEGGGEDNYLVGGRSLGAGDFRVRARISLAGLDGTAAGSSTCTSRRPTSRSSPRRPILRR